MENKQWYESKMLWINVLAIVGIILQSNFGYVLSPELQVAILGIINVILRAITGKPIVWGKAK